MAGLTGHEAQAQSYITNVCKQRGCVYVGSNVAGEPDCRVKYPEEVVRDFETDGCAAAAIPVDADNWSQEAPVIPVTIFGNGKQTRDFIYVKDVVRANLMAAQKAPSGVYNVCTGKKTSFNEIIQELNAVLGAALKPEYFKNPYSFYQNETLGDARRARQAFAFKAQFSTAQGIQDYLGAREAFAV